MGRPPRLHDHAARNDHEIRATDLAAVGTPLATNVSADLCWRARGGGVLFGIEIQFKKDLGETGKVARCWIAGVIEAAFMKVK